MGSYSYGDIRYDFKLEINLEILLDKIMEKIGIEPDDYYLDDKTLVINGTDKCRYKGYYSPATYYDPPEEETELIDSLDDKDIEKAISEALDEFKEYIAHKYVSEVKIDEGSFDYEPDEPDPDRAYDEWKDRQLEGDYE